MSKVLNDSREMTIDQADQLMQDIGNLEIQVIKFVATREKRVADIKSECEETIKPLADEIEEKGMLLQQFIKNNPNRFKKPKARITPFGKYGVRKVSNTEIEDEQAVIEYAKENRLPLFSITEKVDKKAVKAAIEGGKEIPGAEFKEGSESFYKVEKKLLDAAKQNILSD